MKNILIRRELDIKKGEHHGNTEAEVGVMQSQPRTVRRPRNWGDKEGSTPRASGGSAALLLMNLDFWPLQLEEDAFLAVLSHPVEVTGLRMTAQEQSSHCQTLS